jgi:mannose/fructose/N-acetylgalactosamine-specific phosphotransferase system component IID
VKGERIMSEKATMKKTDERDIKKSAWRLITGFQACENFEREQGYDFLYCILPFLKKKYADRPDELKARLKANNNFFNCNPVFTGPIIGLTCAMEENEVDEETIQSVKVGLMGPMAGIGDTLVFTLFISLLFSIGATLALEGSILGPILVIPITCIVLFLCRYYGTLYTYRVGISAMDTIMEKINSITQIAMKFGCVIVGAMVVFLVSASTPLSLTVGESVISVQDKIDSILPNLIPILIVAGCYGLLTKAKLSPVKVLLILIVFGFVASIIGVL